MSGIEERRPVSAHPPDDRRGVLRVNDVDGLETQLTDAGMAADIEGTALPDVEGVDSIPGRGGCIDRTRRAVFQTVHVIVMGVDEKDRIERDLADFPAPVLAEINERTPSLVGDQGRGVALVASRAHVGVPAGGASWRHR